MKVQRKDIPTCFPSSILSAHRRDGQYVVIEQAGACDLPVCYSEKEFNILYQVVED